MMVHSLVRLVLRTPREMGEQEVETAPRGYSAWCVHANCNAASVCTCLYCRLNALKDTPCAGELGLAGASALHLQIALALLQADLPRFYRRDVICNVCLCEASEGEGLCLKLQGRKHGQQKPARCLRASCRPPTSAMPTCGTWKGTATAARRVRAPKFASAAP